MNFERHDEGTARPANGLRNDDRADGCFTDGLQMEIAEKSPRTQFDISPVGDRKVRLRKRWIPSRSKAFKASRPAVVCVASIGAFF